MDTVKIDTRDVNFWYGDFHALKGISMQIEEKSVVAFIGPSGCGKPSFQPDERLDSCYSLGRGDPD